MIMRLGLFQFHPKEHTLNHMTGFTVYYTAYSMEHHSLGFSTSVFQEPNFLCCYTLRLIWEQKLRAGGIKSGNQASEIAQQVKPPATKPDNWRSSSRAHTEKGKNPPVVLWPLLVFLWHLCPIHKQNDEYKMQFKVNLTYNQNLPLPFFWLHDQSFKVFKLHLFSNMHMNSII